MRLLAFAVLLGALLTAPAFAQSSPPPRPPTGGDGPPPAMQGQMETARTTARTAALAALSADHQTNVGAIVSQLQSGQLTDLHDAAQKIDAILTPDESKAVLAARDKMMSDMRAAMPPPDSDGPPRDGAGPGDAPRRGMDGGRMRGDGMHGGSMRRMRNDAGFALLTLALDRDQLRNLFMQQRDRR